MRATLFVICVLGAYSCWSCFRDEFRSGKLYPSLFISAIGWAAGAVAAIFLWSE